MKLEEFEVGQIVADRFGNEYEVREITAKDKMPILLKCIKFVKEVPVQEPGDVKFSKIGQTFYIYKSRNAARSNGDNTHILTIKLLKLKDESR